jgi:hypothetical protein
MDPLIILHQAVYHFVEKNKIYRPVAITQNTEILSCGSLVPSVRYNNK